MFFMVYWILCTTLWICINNHHTNIIPSWLSLPFGFWGVFLSLFIVLSLLLFFIRCQADCEEYDTTFEQPDVQSEIVRTFECERQGKQFDELESVNLNRSSIDFSFVEQAPPRYVNISDIVMDERRNDTMTQHKLHEQDVDSKCPTLVLMKPPLPVKRNLRTNEVPCIDEAIVMTEEPCVTCIPMTTTQQASSLKKTEVYLFVNDARP